MCLAPFIASAQTQPVFPVLTFEPYGVASPLAMAEGDLNGDGAVDTLYVSAGTTAGSSTLTASPRSSSGARQASIAAGSVPCVANSLLLADLNKDNKLDAIVTCNEGVVAILAGNGDGTFGAATTYSVSSAANVVAADLNGDGYPDLVVAIASGKTTSTFAILLNMTTTGSPAFAQPKVYGGAIGSPQVMIGDLNRDGKLDIVAGGKLGVVNGNPAAVFYGNGDGTVQAAASLPGLGPNVALADFDGDGRTDTAKVFANFGAPFINCVLIDFPGENKSWTITQLFPGAVDIQAIDVNGDGHPDVVLTGTTTTILLNDGAGNLTVGRAYATPGAFYTASKGTNGNDLVYATPRGFYTMHGNGKGSFDGLPAFYRSDKAAMGDLNGDGVTDLVTVEQTTGAENTDIARGDGTFVLIPSFGGQPGAFPLLADFNGDGVLDLIEIYSDQPSAGSESRLFYSNGSAGGTFTRAGAILDLGIKSATSAVSGDFDGDGKRDIVVSSFDTSVGANVSNLVLVRGNGDGTFVATATTIASQAATGPAVPVAADLNGDGKIDVVWRNTAYINNGSMAPTSLALPVQGTAMALGDVNGDHIPDVVIDNAVYAGNGDGTFLPQPLATIAMPAGATLISVSIGDVNGDGNSDIVVQYMADMAGFIVAYGDGHGSFTTDANTYTTGTKTPAWAGFARLNNSARSLPGDNRLDYLVFADGAAISLLNQSNPAPGPALLLPTTLTLTLGPASITDPTTPAPLQPVSLFSQVTGVNPTGIVTFTASDGTVLGKATITNGGTVATVQYSFPAAGTYTVTASYPGDGINAPATSAPAKLTVAKYAPTIQMISQPNNLYYTGRTSTLYTSITAYNPTVPITFSSGSTLLGSASVAPGTGVFTPGQAHVPYSFPAAGTYSISASYPGDASNLPATSPSYTITVVDGPDFSISASPTTNTVNAGQTATYTISVTSVRNYAGYVSFTCQPTCPSGQVFVPAGQTATANFSVQTNAPGSGTGAPILRYAPVGMAFLLFGLRRRYTKALAPHLRIGLFAVLLALGVVSISGCSSSKDSSSAGTNTGTAYSIVITGTDTSIQASHSVTLQLIVK
jgi:hypothetical protein